MNDIHNIQEIERYLAGEMSTLEAAAFEAKRRADALLDQQVVQQQQLVQQLEAFGRRKQLMSKLNAIHEKTDLTALRAEMAPKPSKLRFLNRRTLTAVAAAACVALVTSLSTIAVMQKAARKNNAAQYESVRREMVQIKTQVRKLNVGEAKPAPMAPGNFGGTCFAINRYGYMLTNRHVIDGADSIYIQNNKGEVFKAYSVFEDASSDLAVLRLADSTYRTAPFPTPLNRVLPALAKKCSPWVTPAMKWCMGKVISAHKPASPAIPSHTRCLSPLVRVTAAHRCSTTKARSSVLLPANKAAAATLLLL
ncbi:serine protease [Chitinophaga sedimenti]|nr:trypsin-like peptidase domain-containing protein [Chitinophaga sedimenti]MCK7560186.1 serine protease [Chitinophaga sedimenti]